MAALHIGFRKKYSMTLREVQVILGFDCEKTKRHISK
jgi:hypothetical protein